MTEEIIKLKAEIFDIIRQQELYVANANHLQQKRTEKLQELRDAEQKGVSEEITKIKSQAFDIMIQQEAYISETNKLQQMKTQKLQTLNELENNLNYKQKNLEKQQELPIQQTPIQEPQKIQT